LTGIEGGGSLGARSENEHLFLKGTPMIATLLTSVCLSLSPAMIPGPPVDPKPFVAVSGDAIPIIVDGAPQFTPVGHRQCKNYTSGCPAGTILIDNDGEPQGCSEDCTGDCYACDGSPTPVAVCIPSDTGLCGTNPIGGVPVSCGNKLRYTGGCMGAAFAERGIPNMTPSCTCDTSGPGVVVGPCTVRPCNNPS